MNTQAIAPLESTAKQTLTQAFLHRYDMYVSDKDETHLLAFSELGRKMNQAAMPPETLVELYAIAQQRTSRVRDMSQEQRLLPLMEVLMTYGLSYRQHIQWQQEHSNAQFYRVLEASGHLILITDEQQHVHYTNPAFARVFNTSGESESTLGEPFLQAVNSQKQMLAQLCAGQRWQGKVTATDKLGHTVVLEVTAFVVGLGGRQSSHFVFMAEDVTEQLVMEKRLNQSQRLGTLGELASGITHEFNNVMTIISGFAELIRDESDPHSRSDYVREILAAIDKGQCLNQQILSFAADRETAMVPAALPVLVNAIHQFIATAVGSHIQLTVNAIPHIEVKLSEQHLCQILTNLCINARHAIEQNTGRDDGEITLSFSLAEASSWLAISVKDNGCGMTADIREQIFEPFYTTKDIGEGSGLGLSLLQKIVHEYHGEVQVESAPDRGTEFIVHLPVVAAPRTDNGSHSTPAPLLKQWAQSHHDTNKRVMK